MVPRLLELLGHTRIKRQERKLEKVQGKDPTLHYMILDPNGTALK